MAREMTRPHQIAALGVGLEAVILLVWSILVMYSGASGEHMLTQTGNEVGLGAFTIIIALVVGVVAFFLWRESTWATGPAITVQVLIVGGAVTSGDFLSLPVLLAITTYAVVLAGLLLYLRIGDHHGEPTTEG